MKRGLVVLLVLCGWCAPAATAAPTLPPTDPLPPQVWEASLDKPSKVEKLIKIARSYLGVRYLWGGTTRAGLDCSGFVMVVFRRVGVKLPRTTYSMIHAGRPAHPKRRGDLVFTSGGGHVALYLGRGRIIHAPNSGSVVRIEKLGGRYIVAVRRILKR